MAENRLCSLIEANSIEFHKVLSYQQMIANRKNNNA